MPRGRPSIPRIIALAVPSAVLAVLFASPLARAADVSVRNFALRIVAQDARTNIMDITINGFGYDVVDTRSPLRAGSGCRPESRYQVRCFALIGSVLVDLGRGDDELVASEVAAPLEISGGSGEDYLVGGKRGDSLDGGEGADTLDGKAGEDRLVGEEGADSLMGGDDADALDGGEGIDHLQGRGGDDIAIGGPEGDLLEGDGGNDTIDGQSGADGVFDGAGVNRLEGGPDNDLVSTTGSADSTVDCGLGSDRLGATGVAQSDGCDARTDPAQLPQQWPPTGTPGGTASPSCHFFDCPRRLSVEIHAPSGRRRYFTVKVKEEDYRNVPIVVWGVNRRGERVQGLIRRRRWPTNRTRPLRRPPPAKAAVDGRGQLP